jgi:hypothetical protein
MGFEPHMEYMLQPPNSRQMQITEYVVTNQESYNYKLLWWRYAKTRTPKSPPKSHLPTHSARNTGSQ